MVMIFSWWQVVGCCSSGLELNITVIWRVICSPPAKDTEVRLNSDNILTKLYKLQLEAVASKESILGTSIGNSKTYF